MRSECKDLHQSGALSSVSDAHTLTVTVRKAGDRRRKTMQHSSSNPDQEAEARRQTLLEQRHLQTYRNMHRLRDALYRRYAALLRDKVHLQRLVLQQRDEAARAKSETDAKQKQKKLTFTKLQHNDSYLKSLPKTSYYLIFDLQKQLVERGHVKTHHDLEEFHKCIKYNSHPSQLQRSLQDIRKNMLESWKTSVGRPCIAEDRGHKDDVCHSRLPERGSGSGESSELIFRRSQEKDAIEQMFPKMKVPTFATLQPNIMRNFQSKMPDLIIPEIPEKSRKAEMYLRRLREMHDLCLTNMAFSQRLLDRETDSLCWQEERGVQDLVLPRLNSKQGKTRQTNQPPHRSLKLPSAQDDRASHPQQMSTVTSASCRCCETLVLDTAVCCHKTPDPLSIEDVCQQKHVQIIAQRFKLWRNYSENTDH